MMTSKFIVVSSNFAVRASNMADHAFWRSWNIIGTDLNGRKCPVRQVTIPASYNTVEAALRYIQRTVSATVSEIEAVHDYQR
jgi:hypothetical protein